MKLTFKDMVDEVLYDKKPKAKKESKPEQKSEEANIPTPQEVGGAMALAKRAIKKTPKAKEKKVVKEQIETAVETNKKKPKELNYEDVLEQTRKEKVDKKDVNKTDIQHLADGMSHLIKDNHPAQTSSTTQLQESNHLWWIKKGTEYGLASFSHVGEGFYDKAINVKWLPANKKVTEGGEQEYLGYLEEKKLPATVEISKSATTVIKSQVVSYTKQYASDDGTPLDKAMSQEINEQIISSLGQLPIRLSTKKLTESETATVSKTATDLTGMLIENKDMPRIKDMAKRALSKNA